MVNEFTFWLVAIGQFCWLGLFIWQWQQRRKWQRIAFRLDFRREWDEIHRSPDHGSIKILPLDAKH